MKKLNLQVLQEVVLFFLFICVVHQFQVVCFLQPDSLPDESYLGFTQEAAEFSPAEDYDYIIVGGGTAGCSLAATLSEKYSILLLERGGIPGSDPNLRYENKSLNPILTANHNDSPAQNFFSEDGVFNSRGRVLGGSSMINFGFYSRADEYFYQNSGIDFGDMRDVRSAYEWVENTIVTRPDGLRKWQSSTFDGLLEAGVGPNNGFTLDHVEGTKVGGSTFDDSGRRHGAVELLNKANPGNLKILVHATVDRVIFSTSNALAAVGVTYHDSKGTNHEVHIRTDGDVILSSGAIGSPQLLLLSGIGPKSSLSSMNIPVVRDHPFVGQFMADNPRNGVNLLVPVRLNDVGVRVAGITNTGPYVESTAVPRLAAIIPFIPFLDFIPPLNLSVVVLGGKVSRPKSTGSLNLISSDVTISPQVRFNYYSHPEDILQCGNLVEVLRKILETRALEEYKFPGILGPDHFSYIGPSLPDESSDQESIASFCRKTLSTFWHTHGGCLVNKVVDKNLKVIEVGFLRVVDASTFFNSPGTNPQATVMMLGRFIGMKILNERAADAIHT